MCGLVGFYPKKNKKADLKNIYFLTIAIEERGTDSCGIAIGEYLNKGLGNNSKSKDFIANELSDININLINKPVIFHNRSATIKSSLTDEDNIHPFKWTNKKDKNDYIVGMHNGTLRNFYKLKETFCNDYDKSLFKIDSHYILLSLYATNDIKKVLESYEGTAALIFYDEKSFYVWKGANNNVEERPLYKVETEDGWYFCSLENPLKIIFGNIVEEVPNNTLMHFSEGTLKNTTLIPRNISAPVITYGYGIYNSEVNNSYEKIYVQDFYFSDNIFFNISKRRYTNKEGKLIDGHYKVDRNGIISSTGIGKTILFDKGFLVKSYYLVDRVNKEIADIKEFIPELIAKRLKHSVNNVMIDFYEVVVKNNTIFYFRDSEGDLQYAYNLKDRFIEDFTTSVNFEDYSVSSFPKLKLKLHESRIETY